MRKLILAGMMALKLATPGDIDYEVEMENQQSIELDQALDRSITERLEDLLLNLGIQKDNDPEEIYYTYESPTLRTAHDNSRRYRNVIIYEGTFDGTDCRLVVPYGQISSLVVIDGYLTNISSTSVTGRMLYNDDELDPDEYDTYSYILNPVYGSTSNVYTYGSFNYQRHYYVNHSSGYDRITYTDTYGKFYVDDMHIYYSSSERLYYAILIIILLLGIGAIWNRH